MRGDRPDCLNQLLPSKGFTPHARGSTFFGFTKAQAVLVYPACAGIDPAASIASQASSRLPRMRGDRPVAASDSNPWIKFTPHARGSTPHTSISNISGSVYPACAGIDRSEGCGRGRYGCLPRMRGDRPCFPKIKCCLFVFTPHARGST